MTDSFSARRFLFALSALVVVLIAGMVGFRLILHEGWAASLYRSVVTVSLTGLDSTPRGPAAEAYTIVLLLAGVAIFAYVAGSIVEVISRGVLTGAWAEKKRRRAIEALRGHMIICGYGRVGQRIGEEFRATGAPYVVVDVNADALEAARAHADLVVEGSGTDDANLVAAGLLHAVGLVASVDSDTDNLYITLSARAARPDLLIVARASNEAAAAKLHLAGADRVVQPYQTAGRIMANLVLKPQVTAFLDMLTTMEGPDLRFEEIEVTSACGHCGKSIGEVRVRDKTGAMIIGMRKVDGTFDTTPTADAVFDPGDVLIGVGTSEELRALEELFAPREAVAG
jgi:voltage-gated potassium channel